MVVEKELEDYVKAQKTLGVSDAAIRRSLLDAGYSEHEFLPLLAKHAHAQQSAQTGGSEFNVTTRHLLYLNFAVVITFSLLFVYITYDYNAKMSGLRALQEESAQNLSALLASETGTLRQEIGVADRKLAADITQTQSRVETVRGELDTSIQNYNYQSMTRDTSLSNSIKSIGDSSRSQLTSFQEELTTVKAATVDFSPIIPNAVDAVALIGQKSSGIFTTAGSGVFINADGYMVTNHHVIDQINPITVKTHDGNEYLATVVGKDSVWDIAVLKLITEKKNFKYLTFANSGTVFVGQHVIAIGNPVGLESTVTEGIISSTNRKMTVDDTEITYFQTDVAINAGNSGGPLIDKDGNIVGIATLKYMRTGYEGLSFALRANDVQRIVLEILEKGG